MFKSFLPDTTSLKRYQGQSRVINVQFTYSSISTTIYLFFYMNCGKFTWITTSVRSVLGPKTIKFGDWNRHKQKFPETVNRFLVEKTNQHVQHKCQGGRRCITAHLHKWYEEK